MSDRLNPPTLRLTFEELKRRGDTVMADAKQAIAVSRQIVAHARQLREDIECQG